MTHAHRPAVLFAPVFSGGKTYVPQVVCVLCAEVLGCARVDDALEDLVRRGMRRVLYERVRAIALQTCTCTDRGRHSRSATWYDMGAEVG